MRLLKAPIDRDAGALEGCDGGLGKVSDAIIAGDPEIDSELIGKYLHDTARVYIDRQRRIVRKAQQWEVVRNPDGSQRERRPRKPSCPNVGAESSRSAPPPTVAEQADDTGGKKGKGAGFGRDNRSEEERVILPGRIDTAPTDLA